MEEPQAELTQRLRALLVAVPSTREVSIFGGLSFMVNDKMIASALANGDLLVRVAPERDSDLAALPGATPAEMGAGRSMGPGWISVSADSIASDARLSFWIGVAVDYNRSLGSSRT